MKIKIKPSLTVILLTIITNTWTMNEEDLARLEEVDMRRPSEIARYERLQAEKRNRSGCCGRLLSCLSKKKQEASAHEDEAEMQDPAGDEWRTNSLCSTYTPPALLKPFEEWELSDLIEEAIKEKFYNNEGEMTHQTQEALRVHLVELLYSRHQGWN